MKNTVDRYQLLQTFCAVVEFNSFAKAASHLDIPKSSASKHVAQLEKLLNSQLLLRTTRSMSLTDAGKTYYQEGKQLLRKWQQLDESIFNQTASLFGNLTISLPVALGEELIFPIVCQFIQTYPEIDVDVRFTHDVLDIIDDNIDLAIRTTTSISDSSEYKVDLLPLETVLVASAEYLNKHGCPKNVCELQQHRLITFQKDRESTVKWYLNDQPIAVQGQVRTNSHKASLTAALQHLGIAKVYSRIAAPYLTDTHGLQVIPQSNQSEKSLTMLYRQKRRNSPKINAFIEFLQQHLP